MPSSIMKINRLPFVPTSVALLLLGLCLSPLGLAAAQDDTGSLAIVPFANITGSTADAWIGSGIAETLAISLPGDAITIVPDIDAGRAVGAQWVITGSYQRQGDRLRLTARIIELATAAVIDTAIIDGTVIELFALQDRLATALQQRLPDPRPPDTAEDRPTVPPTAPPRPTLDAVAPPPTRPPVATATPDVAPRLIDPTRIINSPPPPIAPATIARNAQGRATLRAVALTTPLDVNGVLDEAIYDTVPSFGDFIQQVPLEGEPSTERTEAWVFFDESNVYVSARLWDSAPEDQWVVNEMRRDSFQLFNNEYFSAVFDTFYDRRNAVGFMVNPIGGFSDVEIADERPSSMDWNPVWEVRTGRFDGGWTVEMAIPFKSIRFRRGQTQLWGLQLTRNIRWKNEIANLTPVPISGGPPEFRISAGGALTGIEVPSGNRTFEIKPYAIGSLATDVNAVPAIINQGAGNAGVDIKYGITENLTADFTYNTDFAQVEVDEQQVNLTRFSLFFPEKREFFLESRGTFDFGRGTMFGGSGGNSQPITRQSGGGNFMGGGDVPTIFFSRRIGLEQGQAVPILGGGRLTGKVGDFNVGALNIESVTLGDADPGETAEAFLTNFSVVRIKRNILRRSSIGAIVTGRSVSTVGPGSNEVYGLDGTFAFYDNVNFNGYYAKSRTPGLNGDDASYQGAFTYNGDLYAVQLDHLRVGDNFNPEIGYLRRDDFRRTFATGQYSPRPESLESIRQFFVGASLDYIENGAGQVETRIAQARVQIDFENSDQFGFDTTRSYESLVRPFWIAPDVAIPIGGYNFQDVYASYTMGNQRRVSGTVTVQHGGFFGGTIAAVGYRRPRIELSPQFSVEPGISINRITLPVGDFTATLLTNRVTYTVTPRMFFGGLVQYNSLSSSLSANLRLRWEYQPGSELFVVYNDQRDTELRGSPLLQNRAFIVKFTRLLRF